MSEGLWLFGLCECLHAWGAHKPMRVLMHLHDKLTHSVRNTWGHDDVSLKSYCMLKNSVKEGIFIEKSESGDLRNLEP